MRNAESTSSGDLKQSLRPYLSEGDRLFQAPAAPSPSQAMIPVAHVSVGAPNDLDAVVSRCDEMRCCVAEGSQLRHYHLREWLFVIALGVFTTLINYAGPHPTCRPFTLTPPDPSINKPYHENTFPVYSLGVIAAVPVFLYIVIARYAPRLPYSAFVSRPRGVEFNLLLVMHVSSMALGLFIGAPIKLYAGRLRPDFIARATMAAATCNITKLALAEDCCMGDASIKQGRRSFPSGHCIVSFSAVVPLCLVLAHRLRPVARGSLPLLFASWLPIALPLVVAVSRTVDNRHHFSDILGGSLIGAGVGVLAYRLMLTHLVKPRDV